jgi:tRNA threonylcarbamoyladenosine biosynthesis protein TsaE
MVDMNTAKTFQTDCLDLDATYRFGEQIGAKLQGGEVFELIGDLGSGKTALVRGVARALGVENEVTSPSFTINNIYKSKKLSIYHYDFYRLSEAGIMANELIESINEPNNVTFIEWGTSVENILPSNKIVISCSTTGENSRHYDCKYPQSLSYLFEGLEK